METLIRPQLDKNLSAESFHEYYWLKEELVSFCRKIGINCSGGKRDIAGRISSYLETGEIDTKPSRRKAKPASRFDWNHESLSVNTTISDNYKNTENVRAFFQQEIGKQFKFNTQFMNWMKMNHGKTLGDAIIEWQRIAVLKKDKNHQTDIAPQFEYNRYTRDFHAKNPALTAKDAVHCWKIKRNRPGNNQYEDKDLMFLDEMKI